LQTDRLDLYLLHWPGEHPLEDTVAGFEALVEEGKIVSWGVSNFDDVKLGELIGIAGEGRIACNQVLYHLGERAIEHAVLPFCRAHHIPVVGYSPFGSGDFPQRGKQRRVLDEIAAQHHTDAYQVALAFLIRQPEIATIPRTANAAHASANAAAASLQLTNDDLLRIEATFPLGRRRKGVPTL
jgi:diketogulonate reductase-like aldo/keto reductase